MTDAHHKLTVVKVNLKMKIDFLIRPQRPETSLHLTNQLAFPRRSHRQNFPLNQAGVSPGVSRRRKMGDGATPGPEDNGFSSEVWAAGARGLKEEPSWGVVVDSRAAGSLLTGGQLRQEFLTAPAVTRHLFKPDGSRGEHAEGLSLHFRSALTRGRPVPYPDSPRGSFLMTPLTRFFRLRTSRWWWWGGRCLFFPPFPHFIENVSLFLKSVCGCRHVTGSA